MPKPREIRYLADTSLNTLAQELASLEASGAKTILALACAANSYPEDELTLLLQSQTCRIMGAVFPSIVHGTELYESGVLLLSYEQEFPLTVYQNLSTGVEAVVENNLPTDHRGSTNLLVFVDALSGAMEDFLESLYHHLGSGPRTIGGGAGSLDFVQRPCIFSNLGFIEDAAIVASLPGDLHMVTGHGWEILGGPYVVTESEGHKVISINYQAAFEVYQQAIQSLRDTTLNAENFFDIAMHYPLGISELSGEILVRDPITTEDGAINLVGNVQQNSTVYILQGAAESLIKAADETSKQALANTDCKDKTVLLFDCVSRKLYLKDQAIDELSNINRHLDNESKAVGAFTLGEIANLDGGPIQLLNKSFALGSF